MKIQILFLAGCVAFATSAFGQNDPAVAPANPAVPANPPPAAPTNAPVADPVVPPSTGVLPASGLTNAPGDLVRTGVTNEVVPLIVIDDVPLIDAVKNLARQAGLNYLPDPKLSTVTNQPNVTMRLENVSAQDALYAVLETYNLQVIHDPRYKVSRITVKDPKAADPLFSKIIQLKYIQPTGIVDIVKRTLSDRGQVMGDPRTSQLIVLATEKEFPAVEELIARLDTPTRQVLIEAQLWETAKNPRSVKGINWQGTFEAQNVSYGNGFLDSARSTVRTVTPGATTTVPTPGGGSTTRRQNSSTVEDITYVPGNGNITLDSARGFHPSTAFLNADGLNAVISFFNSENDTEIVATPRAVTLDNQSASLSVTRAFPIFKITPGSANSPAGAEITYTNLGTILNVTPHITANSNISLRVVPEVSDVAAIDRQIVNGFENTANIYAIRRMETHVMIPSGNTLVLGGLISDRTGNQRNKVPILGDTPFLGALFRHTDKKRDKANLVVFVTPTIVGDYDFQVSSTEFMQTRMPYRPEPKENFMDSAKAYDWTKPKASSEDVTPVAAPMKMDTTTVPGPTSAPETK